MGIDKRPHLDAGRGQSGDLSYLHRIRRDKSIARAVTNILSDLTGVPLSFWIDRAQRDVWSAIKPASASLAKPFSHIAEFHAFVALANRRPEKLMAKFGDQPQAWRLVFEALECEILLARGRRTEPLVRLLRDHWPWRWLEVASVYDARVNGSATPLAWQSQFSNGLLTSSFVPDGGSPFLVLVGPFRNAEHAEQSYACLTQMVTTFYDVISRHRPPLYSLDRLSQFFFSRSALSNLDIVRLNEAIAYALGVLATYGPDSRMDLADLQSAVIFGHALAGVRADASTSSSGETGGISVAVNYNLLRGGDGPSDRSVLFEGSISPLSGVTRKGSLGANDAPAVPGVRSGNTVPPQFVGPPAVERALTRELSKSALAIQSASALQGLEELLLLRYKLSDNFGVLTAYGTAAPQSPLQGTGDEDADRAVDKELGRRIAREVAEVTGANIGVIYRYNYLENHLEAVGLHADTGSRRRVQLSDYEWMIEAGHNDAVRQDSVAYNAADLNHPASFASMIPAGGLTREMVTQAPPPESSSVPRGGAILAVPIRVFGRVWGVVEVVSTRPGWFDTRALEMLQRVADLIGPYYHEHLLMKMLYNIADIPADDVPGRAFVTLAEELREMTLSDAACVWLSDSMNSDEFSLSGCSGRQDLETSPDDDRPKITKDATNSIASDLVSRHRTWFAGTIGEQSLSGKWLDKPHTRSLQAAGFKYLALLPVYGEDFSRKAVISLYSRKFPFSESWQSWGAFIANYIGVVLSRVYNLAEAERSGRRVIAHEVTNAVRVARGSADKVFAWAASLPKQTAVHPELHNWQSDVTTYLDLIRDLVSAWADPETGNLPAELVVLTALRLSVASRPTFAVSLRDEFNSSLQPLSKDMRSKGVEPSVNIEQGDVSVLVHREVLKMIFSNLSANAVKYSNPGSFIQCNVNKVRYGLRMVLRNLGPALAPGEEDRIFDMEFRGARTRGRVPGKGLGLYIAKQVCDAYGITLSYDAKPTSLAGEVWHQFSLEFPGNLIDFWGYA